MTGMTLERRGYRVLLASNGKEALSVFEADPGISLVVLDLSMPEMGGAECLVKINALRPEIPIILSSGYNESDAVGCFTSQDLAGFVQKPYTVADLARKIKTVLRPGSQQS